MFVNRRRPSGTAAVFAFGAGLPLAALTLLAALPPTPAQAQTPGATLRVLSPRSGDALGSASFKLDVAFESESRSPVTTTELWVDGVRWVRRDLDTPRLKSVLSFDVDGSSLASGAHTIVVKVFCANGAASSTEIKVGAGNDNGVSNNTFGGPDLSFAMPGNGKSVNGTIEILLDAKTRGGVNPYITFYVDKQFKTLKNYPPYSYTWDSTEVANGYHTIEASGYLESSNITTTRRLRVFVDNPGGATVRRNDVPDLSRARESASVSAATATAKPLAIPLPPKFATVRPVAKTAAPRISAVVARPAAATTAASAATLTPASSPVVAAAAATTDKFAARGASVALAAMGAFASVRSLSAAAPAGFVATTAPAAVAAPFVAAPFVAAPRSAKMVIAPRAAASVAASALAPAANAAPAFAARSAASPKLSGGTLIAPSPARPTPTTIIFGKRSVATMSIAKPGAPPRFAPVLPVEKVSSPHPSASGRVSFRVVAPGTRFSERKGAVQVAFDGERLAFDVQPRIAAGMPVAPFRQIFEHTGGRVEWASQTRTVRAVNADREVVFAVGKKTARVNGENVSMARPAQLEQGRAIVPLSFVGKALDVDVQYDPATGRLQITSKK